MNHGGIMNQVDMAWAAGLFEGEGCFFFEPRRAGQGAKLAMTDEDIVRRFADIVGIGRIFSYQPKRANEKRVYTWAVYSFEHTQAIIAMLWPWLGERRRAKARDLLAWCRTRPGSKGHRWLNIKLGLGL
jgi:hypothetical protein